MKSFSSILILFGISAMTQIGCKSPTSAVSSAPYVTITPSNLRQTEFVIDTFQARIFNHDFAQTYFTWNMGDDTTILVTYFPEFSFQAVHSYEKPGTYTVTVKAYDIYSKSVIASTTAPIIIDTAKSSVEIIPQFYNGVGKMNSLGNIDSFLLSIKTSLPQSNVYQFWDFGDGTVDSYVSGSFSHRFPHAGTYLMKVDVYQTSGIYVGTDTALIHIDFPHFSIDTMKNSQRVEAYLFIDSSFNFFSSAKDYLPISIGQPFQDANITSSWNGNRFSVEFINSGQDYLLKGQISSDGKKADSLTVIAIGTSFEYRYDASDLPLIAITGNKFIYKLDGDALKNNMIIAGFFAKNYYVQRIGTIVDESSQFFNVDKNFRPTIPACVLVFAR